MSITKQDNIQTSDEHDPFVDFRTLHDRGGGLSSTSGAFAGSSLSSNTTDVGGGVSGSFSPSQHFDISANQRLTIAGMFRYDSLRTNYGVSPAAPAAGSAASLNESLYSLGGSFRYYVGTIYFGGGLSGNWGSDNLTDRVGTSSGKYGTDGFQVFGTVGNTFTLFDSRVAPSPRFPTKAPVKAQSGGYAVELDTSIYVAYDRNRAGGYADAAGFIWGNETERFGEVGGQARLFMTIPRDGLIWKPFVAATFEQQFGYLHTLAIPVQAASTGDTIFYSGPQTFGGVRAGISAQAANGIIVGIQGFYKQSSEYTIAGGQAFLRYALPITR